MVSHLFFLSNFRYPLFDIRYPISDIQYPLSITQLEYIFNLQCWDVGIFW